MLVTKTICDLCEKPIDSPDKPLIIKAQGRSNSLKKIGCDIPLTPRGHRMQARTVNAMIRMNASFYCGFSDSDVSELHFHSDCIEDQIKSRVLKFFSHDTGEDCE